MRLRNNIMLQTRSRIRAARNTGTTMIEARKKLEAITMKPSSADKNKIPITINNKIPATVNNKLPVSINTKIPVTINTKSPVTINNKPPVTINTKLPVKQNKLKSESVPKQPEKIQEKKCTFSLSHKEWLKRRSKPRHVTPKHVFKKSKRPLFCNYATKTIMNASEPEPHLYMRSRINYFRPPRRPRLNNPSNSKVTTVKRAALNYVPTSRVLELATPKHRQIRKKKTDHYTTRRTITRLFPQIPDAKFSKKKRKMLAQTREIHRLKALKSKSG